MSEFYIHGGIKAPLRRIISLAPSITEMLFYLGLGESVVGVTRQCDYPAAVSGIENVGSFLIPDTERILELSPDAVIGIKDLHGHLPKVLRDNIGVILFDYHSVAGILDVMEAVSSLGGQPEAGLERAGSLRRRVEKIQTENSGEDPVRTLFLITESPLMLPARGSYHYDALRITGAAQVTNGYAQYERVTLEEVVYFDPEVILACGTNRGKPPRKMCPGCQSAEPPCQRIVDDIALKPGWKDTTAAQSGNIVALPCDWLCRAGPRLIDGMESIAGILRRYRKG
jgi:iron complex transport system substrate-binding protein